jgi:hypothetical protein
VPVGRTGGRAASHTELDVQSLPLFPIVKAGRQLLARCPTAGSWSPDDADAWWGRHERGLSPAPAAAPETSQASAVYERTMIANRPEE